MRKKKNTTKQQKTWVPFVQRYTIPSLVDFGPMFPHGEDDF